MNIASLSSSFVRWCKYCRKLVIKHLITKLINTQLRTFFVKQLFSLSISAAILSYSALQIKAFGHICGENILIFRRYLKPINKGMLQHLRLLLIQQNSAAPLSYSVFAISNNLMRYRSISLATFKFFASHSTFYNGPN